MPIVLFMLDRVVHAFPQCRSDGKALSTSHSERMDLLFGGRMMGCTARLGGHAKLSVSRKERRNGLSLHKR